MPYRRLPNTDNTRLKAMKKALSVAQNIPPYKLAYSVSSFQKLKYFYPEFVQEIEQNKDLLNRQTEKNKLYQEAMKKAKMYISHFIQVLNFAIVRGEMKPETRNYFNLQDYDKKLPLLTTEADIINWGSQIIVGEQKRISEGLPPITNPHMARVKIHYDNFFHLHKNQKNLQEIHIRSTQKITDLRKKADTIILTVWNEVEQTYANLPPEIKRKQAEEYGVNYVFRKNEKMSFLNANLQEVASELKQLE